MMQMVGLCSFGAAFYPWLVYRGIFFFAFHVLFAICAVDINKTQVFLCRTASGYRSDTVVLVQNPLMQFSKAIGIATKALNQRTALIRSEEFIHVMNIQLPNTNFCCVVVII